MWVNGWGEWFGGESFVKFSLLYFIKNSLLNWSGTSSRKIYKRIPCNFDLCSFYKEFSWDFFFTWKSFVKFFRIFKLESDFFPHFFLQNQKTRKLCTFISFELHMIQFSAKSGTKKFFTSLSLSLHFHFHFHFHFTFTSLHLRLIWQVSRVVST